MSNSEQAPISSSLLPLPDNKNALSAMDLVISVVNQELEVSSFALTGQRGEFAGLQTGLLADVFRLLSVSGVKLGDKTVDELVAERFEGNMNKSSDANRYVPDGTKAVRSYIKANFVEGERNQKDFAAKCFAEFAYYVAATMLLYASKDHPPKRVILPIRPFQENDDVFNLTLEVREPNNNWQHEELFQSDKEYEPWTAEAFDKVLGSAVVANDNDDGVTIDQLRDQYKEMTVELCGRQFSRRFTWGVVIRGSMVEVKKACPSCALEAYAFDMATGHGREAVVNFLVCLSYCEKHKLGFDPTVRYLKDLKCWEVKVPDEGGKDKVFYGYDPEHFPFYNPNYSFSKYMIAKATKPTLNPDGSAPEYRMDKNDVTIKDLWRAGDEVEAMQIIMKRLENNKKMVSKDVDVKLLAGGVVQVGGHDDSEKYIFEEDGKWLKRKPNIHQRIASQGVFEFQDRSDKEFCRNRAVV